MDLLELRTAVVNDLSAAINDVTDRKITVESHPGRFELAEIERYAAKAPCIRVALLTSGDKDLALPVDDVELTAFILTKNGKAGLPDGQMLVLATYVMALLKVRGKIAADAGSPQRAVFRNLFTTSVGSEGLALGAVSWRQTLGLPELGDEALGSFQKLFATWDLGPTPDGQPEAQNSITLEGA